MRWLAGSSWFSPTRFSIERIIALKYNSLIIGRSLDSTRMEGGVYFLFHKDAFPFINVVLGSDGQTSDRVVCKR